MRKLIVWTIIILRRTSFHHHFSVHNTFTKDIMIILCRKRNERFQPFFPSNHFVSLPLIKNPSTRLFITNYKCIGSSFGMERGGTFWSRHSSMLTKLHHLICWFSLFLGKLYASSHFIWKLLVSTARGTD